MGRIQYEHPFLERALKRVGVLTDDFADGPVALVIAWSSRSLLLERPEYAVLSRPTVGFLQLPQSFKSLTDSLVALGSTQDPEVETLSKPLGQLQWAIEALEKTAASEDNDRALSRLKYLQRFASKYWPGWYDPIIAGLRERIEAHGSITELARASLSLSKHIAAIEACRPLMAWMDDEYKRDCLTTSLDALCYASQGLLPAGAVGHYVYRDAWWDDLKVDLASALTAVDELRDCKPFQDEISARLESIREQLTLFDKIVRTPEVQPGHEPSPSDVQALFEKLGKLVENLLTLLRVRKSTRTTLLAKLAEDKL